MQNLANKPASTPGNARANAVYRVLFALVFLLVLEPAPAERDSYPDFTPAEPVPAPVYAEIRYAKTALRDGLVLLDCATQLRLPPLPEAALSNGLPLVFVLKIEIERSRRWWFDETIAQVNVRFRLEYLELARRYRLTQLNTDKRTTFGSLRTALRSVARLKAFPLIEAEYVDSDENYAGSLVLTLDREALPLPLRPQAYLSDDWAIQSEVYTWAIQ